MPASTRTVQPDAAGLAAQDLARAAAQETAGDPDAVGEWLGATGGPDRLVTHAFAARLPAYRGWHWAATVVRASRARVVTVDEVVLLPGEGSLLAPEWLPWSDRIRPGDLGVGDVMVTDPDDPRLVPTAFATEDDEQAAVAFEVGLGRVRSLSAEGRDEAADRWYAGEPGPQAPIAKSAAGRCAGCGFWLPLRGDLGRLFGGCGNEYAPDDGRLVAADHGCGAHSEAGVAAGLVPAAADPAVPPATPDQAAEELGHS